MSELTAEQQAKILQSHLFIGQMRTGETKARMVTGGNTQCGHVTKEELSSPTVSTEAVLSTSIVDAREGRDVAVVDIPNAFIQTKVDDAKDCVIILDHRSDCGLAGEGSAQSVCIVCCDK